MFRFTVRGPRSVLTGSAELGSSVKALILYGLKSF